MNATIDKIKNWLNMRLFDVAGFFIKPSSPTTLTGIDSSLQLCRLLPAYGASHVLLVTDKDLVNLGLIDRCIAELEKFGIQVTVFDRITPDPTESQIEAGLTLARQSGCNSILGFGGGSPMDAAKIIAAGALGTLKVPQMKGAFKFKTKPLPLFLVPTTAGTGAETTVGAVVSSKSEDNKYAVIDTKLLPLVIALDHQLMLGIPPKITAETGIDALTHAVESYIGTRATEKTKRASITAIKLVFNYLERAYNNGQDIEAREAMAFAAYQGGVALEASAGYVHAIAHQLGARYHLTHGHCNAVIMPHVLEYSLSKASKPLAELANVIGVSSTQKTERENAQLFIDAIKDLNNKLGITQILPGIKTEEIPQLFKKAQEEAMSIYGVVRYMTQSDGEALIHKLIPTA